MKLFGFFNTQNAFLSQSNYYQIIINVYFKVRNPGILRFRITKDNIYDNNDFFHGVWRHAEGKTQENDDAFFNRKRDKYCSNEFPCGKEWMKKYLLDGLEAFVTQVR